jgi:hypothetical protein
MSISSLFSALVGLAMLAGCFWFILHLQQKRWNWFSSRFGVRQIPDEIASKPGAAIVFSSAPNRELLASDYTTCRSITLAMHRKGLSVRVRGPNYYANQPFLLPFEGLRVQPSRWPDLLYDTVAVSHRRLPGAYLIMAKDDIDWAIAQGAPITIGQHEESR